MTALPQSRRWTIARDDARPRWSLAAAWPAAVLVPLFVALAIRSWGTWPDPVVDFGRELYVPWRMTEGDALYRDLAYFNGPLSPAVNALWFWLFGTSLRTLVAANLAIAAATTAALYWLLRQMASRPAATAACAAFLLLSVFSQFTHTRNYNFVCPYSHEMTHGLVLSLAATAAARQVERRGITAAAFAGALVGLVFLTKPEMAIAATAAVAASLILLSLRGGFRTIAARVGVALIGAAAPPLIAIAALTASMPFRDAAAGCFGAWQMAGLAEIRELEFYRRGLGTFDVAESLAAMAVSAARWTVLLAAAWLLARITAALPPWRRRATAAAVGVAATVGLLVGGFNWPLMERALPVAMLVLAAWHLWLISQSDDATDRRQAAFRAIWCIFALALLAKIALFSHASHYGFVLAGPAIAAVLLAMFDWLPAAARRRGAAGECLPWLAAPLVAAYLVAYQGEQTRLTERAVGLGVGADQFAAAADAAPVVRAQEEILQRVAPQDTVAVMPEGVMLNYLTRRAAPTKFITWMPPELYFFGEAPMLRALQATPPDWVLVAPRDLEEYGVPPWGEGYADSIAHWIDANFDEVVSWTGEARGNDDVKWRLLRRNAR